MAVASLLLDFSKDPAQALKMSLPASSL